MIARSLMWLAQGYVRLYCSRQPSGRRSRPTNKALCFPMAHGDSGDVAELPSATIGTPIDKRAREPRADC